MMDREEVEEEIMVDYPDSIILLFLMMIIFLSIELNWKIKQTFYFAII